MIKSWLCVFCCFFFFQAEDGIRDYKVTGVQTCALPISVQVGAALAGLRQLAQSRLGHLPQICDRAEVDGFGRARLGARGLEAHLHPVVAEGAFLRRARYRIDVDDPEGARADAVAAAVAGVRLDDDGVELRPDDGARRAHLEAAGVDAVLADVAHHQPAPLASVRAELLDELHVTPVDAVEMASVVIAIAAQGTNATIRRRKLIPLLAGDLARLAADAHRRIREEPHRLAHEPFSTLQTKAFPS